MRNHDNNSFVTKQQDASADSIFALRGDLDGEKTDDFGKYVQYIGLLIGEEEFILPISEVSEIVMIPTLTYVPGAPKFITGVINLRGSIIPAINLRDMMGLETKDPNAQTRIIVVKVGDFFVGLIVDGITYVIPIAETDIDSSAVSSSSAGAELLCGIGNRGEKVNGIISVEKIINTLGGGSFKLDEEE